jgi:hypothetical protein
VAHYGEAIEVKRFDLIDGTSARFELTKVE